jgi:DNA-binding transcriptional LysR family regulator
VRLEIGSNEAIKEAVAAGMGIAIVSRHALGGKSAGPGLAILDVAGFPLHSNWWILYPRGKSLSPIATRFLDELARPRELSGG